MVSRLKQKVVSDPIGVDKEMKISELPSAENSLIDDLLVISQSDGDGLLRTKKILMSLLIKSLVSDRSGNLVSLVDGFKLFADKSVLDGLTERAEDAAGRAENTADANTYYITPDDPDGTIAGLAGTPFGKSFRVGQGEGKGFKYYMNLNGTALEFASAAGASDVENAIDFARKSLSQSGEVDKRTQGYGVEKKVYDTEGVLVGGGFFAANGVSPINYTENGDVNITGVQFKNLGNHHEYDWAQTDKKNVPYIGGSKMGGVIIGRVEIVEIPGPPGVVFVDKGYVPYACDPGYETDLDIPVIGSTPRSLIFHRCRSGRMTTWGCAVRGSRCLLVPRTPTMTHSLSAQNSAMGTRDSAPITTAG
ncbi:hypothetical protein [Serratia sp. 1D1416]|uniref:hypothetical protein n=1 Tax=Serratia sp. 1D1416 TaxID=2447890 RepID=UPI0013EB7663|nr:hypothetical protein [Serratia sp. 1D1416]